MGRTVLRIVDSNATLLVLLLANFFLLELIDDPRWGALLSTLLAAVALVVAISDPDAGDDHEAARGLDRGLRRPGADRAFRQLGVGGRAHLSAASCSS